jgi:hypothetical protein
MPVGSPSVTARGLMRKDVLLLNGGGGQVHGRRWYQEFMEKAAWRTSVDSVLSGIQVFAWSRNSLERQPRLTLGPCCNTDRQTDRRNKACKSPPTTAPIGGTPEGVSVCRHHPWHTNKITSG